MKKIITSFLILLNFNAISAPTERNEICHSWAPLVRPVCQHLHQIWTKGQNELYISGYAWHNRYTYTREKINRYNEAAWGGGLGKGLFDEKGNWHGLYAIAFLDSHRNIEPAAGYAYLKVATINKDIKAGIGYSVLVTSREDINHNIPFPGILPWASIFIQNVSIAATYIPGFNKNGNVLYILAKYTI